MLHIPSSGGNLYYTAAYGMRETYNHVNGSKPTDQCSVVYEERRAKTIYGVASRLDATMLLQGSKLDM